MANSTKSGRDDTSAATATKDFSLSRWSRLKHRAANDKASLSVIESNDVTPLNNGAMPDDADSGSLVTTPKVSNRANAITDDTASAETDLPSLADVGLEKDFTPFMQAKVPEVLRRQALKTLFKDAHFNTMDGLDTYIDDYTQFEPISAEDLEKLSAWQSIKNPLQQVVTPGGYAVDVNSEEGKAVLAAREASEALARGEPTSEPVGAVEAGSDIDAAAPTEVSSDALSPSAPIAVSPTAADGMHARYGKRVGDFKINIPPLDETISSTTAHPNIPAAVDAVLPTANVALDPR